MEKDQFLQKLEADGEAKVRRDVASGHHSGARLAWANEWLAEKDAEKEREQKLAEEKNFSVNERSATAIEKQAHEASEANKIAKRAFYVSLVALAVAALALLKP